jgi:hypothetical protein
MRCATTRLWPKCLRSAWLLATMPSPPKQTAATTDLSPPQLPHFPFGLPVSPPHYETVILMKHSPPNLEGTLTAHLHGSHFHCQVSISALYHRAIGAAQSPCSRPRRQPKFTTPRPCFTHSENPRGLLPISPLSRCATLPRNWETLWKTLWWSPSRTPREVYVGQHGDS